MPYTTPQLILERFGAAKVAQLCAAKVGVVLPADLLTAAASAGDVSAWSAEQQQQALEAIAWIEARIEDAVLKVNSYISGRYTLPLSAEQISASTLPEYTEVISHYAMMVHGADEATQKRYEEAIAWLKDVSKGVARIGGVIETEAVQVDQRRLSRKAPSGIDWSNYP